MFQNMKLGTKIILGFGILLGIVCILGGLAVWNMNSVGRIATLLFKENLPEVTVANNVERWSLKTMFEMRGFAYTEDQEFYDKAAKNLTEVKKFINQAKNHGASSERLAKLKEAAEKAEAEVLEYERLAEEGRKLTKGLEEERRSAESSAKKYMELCYDFLGEQKLNLDADLAAGKDVNAIRERVRKMEMVSEIVDLGNWIIIGTWKSQFRRDPKLLQETGKFFDQVNMKLDELKAITKQTSLQKMIEDCRTAGKAYRGNMDKFLIDWQERENLTQKRVEVSRKVLELAQSTAEMSMDNTSKASEKAASALGTASTIILAGLILAIITGVFATIFITRSITLPISRIIADLSEASEQISSASSQISSAGQSLAEGSSQQAASIEESSSSLEEMSSMTKQNADNANQANTLMSETRKVVDTANASMTRLTESMKEITRASEETSKIIKTIDEIAFQTNLLALNAAVEAARAGEAGAGFAVVADEVRNLAMRASAAAKNTADLIEGTVKKVKDGSALVDSTNEAFQQVAERSTKVGQLVSEIAASSNEQAQGIEQINKAVTEMDKVTQQNAANAEESASASEEMSAQSGQLQDMVGELTAMVGAAAERGTRNPERGMIRNKTGQTGKAEVGIKPARNASAKIAKEQRRPEEVIPMEEDFKDF